MPKLQASDHILDYTWRRCRCKSQHRDFLSDDAPGRGDSHIVRAEVIAPLTDAVALIHHHQRYVHRPKPAQEKLVLQSLGSNIEDLVVGGVDDIVQYSECLSTSHPAIECLGIDPKGLQLLDLISHQRHKRGDHECDPLEYQGGHLEGNRLTSPRGHKRKGVVPPED